MCSFPRFLFVAFLCFAGHVKETAGSYFTIVMIREYCLQAQRLRQISVSVRTSALRVT